MPRDKSTKDNNNNKDTRRIERREYKKHQSSDDDDSEIEETIDIEDYRNMLADLFPSKYSKERAKKGRKSPKDSISKKKKRASKPSNNYKSNSKDKKRSNAKYKRRAKKQIVESESEESDSEYIEELYSDNSDHDSEFFDEEDEEELEELFEDAKGSKFNIIFTVGGKDVNEDEFTDEDYLSDEDETTDDEYCSDNEDDASDQEDADDTDDSDENSHTESFEGDKKSKKKKSNIDNISNEVAISKIKSMLDHLSPEEKENHVFKSLIKDFKKQEKALKKCEDKKARNKRKKNAITFQKMLRENNVMNDVKYFRDKIPVEKQQAIIDEIINIKKHCEVSKPYRLTLVEADIPVTYKACAYRKINTLKYMEPGSGEYYKIKNWVDTFMQIPFGKFKNLPLTIEDGVEKCHDFMDNAKQILDTAVYGLDDAKLQIMQFVGQWIANPNAIGSAIAIKGPMGTGKTTLVKEGISKILGRDFAFLALGGATDSSFLEGHSYTYEGSTWGKMLDIIIQSKTMNPVIYFDELDKLSDTPKGEEIAGILTHLTDTSQNSKFHDKYFSEVDFDLSRCLFIFSYNDESKVNPILLDRMYRIQTKGYDKKEKTTIAYKYLLPKISEQVKFTEEDITIPEETLHHIIDDHTDKEDGVRNLKRCLEIIYTKLNLYRLMKPGSNLFEKDMSLKVEFPATITIDMISKILKKNKENGSFHHMYM